MQNKFIRAVVALLLTVTALLNIATVASAADDSVLMRMDWAAFAWTYNGKTYKASSGTWIPRNSSWKVEDVWKDGHLNAWFCSQWGNAVSDSYVQMDFYDTMENVYNAGKLTYSPEWAYRCIISAEGIWSNSAYNLLDDRQKLLALNVAMVQEGSNSYVEANRLPPTGSSFTGVATTLNDGDYSCTAAQSAQMVRLAMAIRDAAENSTAALPEISSRISRTLVQQNYWTTLNGKSVYVLGRYTLDRTGVTASIGSGSTSGVKTYVSGKTLYVYIEPKDIPSGKTITAAVNLSINTTVQTMLMYQAHGETVTGDGNPNAYQLLCTYGGYSYSASGNFTVTRTPEENGYVEVYKKDSTNGKNLSGAVFTITNRDTDDVFVLTTNSSGYAKSTRLDIGRYTITETKAPDGYKLDNWSQNFEITAGITEPFSYTVENEPDSKPITIKKTVSGGGTKEGWEFKVYSSSSLSNSSLVGTYRSGSDGTIITGNFPAGTYYVVESGYPEGMSSEEKAWWDITIPSAAKPVEAGGTVTFTNYYKGKIKGFKKVVDADGNEVENPWLEGWQFLVRRLDVPEFAGTIYTTNDKGFFITDLLSPSTYFSSANPEYGGYYYIIKEVGYPENMSAEEREKYELDDTEYHVWVAGGKLEFVDIDGNDLIWTNEYDALNPGKITVQKVDEYGTKLSGVTFQLEYSIDGGETWNPVKYISYESVEEGGCTSVGLTDGTLTTGSDGLVTFEGLHPLHDYRLTEVSTLSGYQLLTGPVYVGPLPPEKDLELEFTVVNHAVPTLPATGSSDMLIFIIAAIAIATVGSILVAVSKHRNHSGV